MNTLADGLTIKEIQKAVEKFFGPAAIVVIIKRSEDMQIADQPGQSYHDTEFLVIVTYKFIPRRSFRIVIDENIVDQLINYTIRIIFSKSNETILNMVFHEWGTWTPEIMKALKKEVHKAHQEEILAIATQLWTLSTQEKFLQWLDEEASHERD